MQVSSVFSLHRYPLDASQPSRTIPLAEYYTSNAFVAQNIYEVVEIYGNTGIFLG